MKIIFLDIDGVLNRLGTVVQGRTMINFNGVIGMEPELVKRFNELVRKTGARVVLSSTWRLSDTWRADMRANGLEMEFLDRTDDLYDPKKRFIRTGRGIEINKWLSEHPKVEKYVIIDDDSDMLPGQVFFKTSSVSGLTHEIAEQIEKCLI